MQEKRFKGLSFKKKFMLLLLGMTGAVVFLEILLQSGAFLARLNASFAVKKPDNQSCRVLCLGDSFTYGIGAQKKYSYPAQLQKLLDEKSGPGRFTVINSGEPGINTPMLCDKLQRLLDEFEPDIVLLMVGVNDSWNLEGKLLNQRMSLDDFFCWSRAYKFIKIAVFNIQRVNFLKEAKPDEGGWSSQHNKAEKVFGNTGFLFNNYFHAIMLANYAR
ncbi:MAG: hypothetical protein HY810_04660 [Candidatus Omnitrophica bacterium]|nr:hypothetical protein [Candidatus Omnitrophota bacterium]